MNRFTKIFTVAALATTVAAIPDAAEASSHREAPAIAEDQFVDNTDVYTFISPNNPDRLVVVANYVPLLIPHSGPNFYRFSDDALYEILFDNDGDAVPDVKYVFKFQTTIGNGETFLYNVGPIDSLGSENLNVKQSYDLFRVSRKAQGNGVDYKQILNDVPTAPWYVGDRSFPDGSYEGVARQAIASAEGGESTFVGPRDEPFFVDLHVFDLLGVGGAPTTDGVNVMSIVMEIPIDSLAAGGARPAAGDTSPSSVVGVYARASRPLITIRFHNKDPLAAGGWVQVSRLAWPLVNEVVVPLQDKNKFNRSNPVDDVTNFGAYILDPELPGLLNAVLDAGCAPTPADGRLDIVGLLSPSGTTAADLLRINITTGQTFAESAFPNGRALEDDVTDTLLTVVCNNGGPLGDAVDENDLAFFDEMPYLATPHSGNPIP
jgi:hypothetical protein